MRMRLKQIVRGSIDEILLAGILGLSVAAVAAIAVDPQIAGSRQPASGGFQRLLGGLGLGCQADLAHCAWQFDPRLMGDEDAPLDVVADSHVSNPWHSLSLFPPPDGAWDAPRQD